MKTANIFVKFTFPVYVVKVRQMQMMSYHVVSFVRKITQR